MRNSQENLRDQPPFVPVAFRYRRWFFYLMLLCALVLLAALASQPPTHLMDWFGAIVLTGGAVYLSIHTAAYQLVLHEGLIERHSPWPWERQVRFDLRDIVELKRKYQALHITLVTKSGHELQVPLLLSGSMDLLKKVVEQADAQVGEDVRNIIRRFS